MNIEIINKDGDLITNFELESNPFKLGEIITISVSNHNKSFWDVEEITASVFKIKKIEHLFRKTYTLNKKCRSEFTVSVEVSGPY